MSFATKLPIVLKFEGGKVDNPNDPGGRTAYGITQATYNAWCADQRPPMPPHDVWEIEPDQVEAIYRQRYWDAINGDALADISAHLALCVFDGAVNHGVGLASRLLQRVVASPADGVIGPKTLMAVTQSIALQGQSQIVIAYLRRRMTVYLNIILNNPSQRVFEAGWRKRINTLATEVGISPIWESTHV
jgi:lysozyme family protein